MTGLAMIYPLLGWLFFSEFSGAGGRVAFWCASGAWMATVIATPPRERRAVMLAGIVATVGLMIALSAPIGKGLTFILCESGAIAIASFALSRLSVLQPGETKLVALAMIAGIAHALLLSPAGAWLLTGLEPGLGYATAWQYWISANIAGAFIAVPFIVLRLGRARQAERSQSGRLRLWGWAFLLCMFMSSMLIAISGGIRWNLETTMGWANYIPLICAVSVSLLWPTIGSVAATAALFILELVLLLTGTHLFGAAALSLGQSSQLRWYLAAVAILSSIVSALARELQATQYEISRWKARYESTVSSTPILHYDIDLQTSQVLWIGDTRRCFGAPSTQLSAIGDWVSQLHPKDRERFGHQLNSIAEGNDYAPDLRYRVLLENGNYVPLRHHVTGITAFEGTVLRVEGTVQAATTRTRGRLNLYRQASGTKDDANAEGVQRPAVLMIHGIGGSEHDFGPLYKALALHGFDPQPLTLPGHRGRPEDLLKVSAEDWIQAARERYHVLQQRYPVVHVMGISLGALIALEIVKTERVLSGKLVLLSSPIFIDGWAVPWYYALRFPLYKITVARRLITVDEEDPYGVKDERVRAIVAEKFARGESYHYPYVPLGCVQQIDRLRAMIRKTPPGIDCQTLLIHSHEDDLTSAKSAEWLQRHLGEDRTELVMLNNSYHMVCIDNDRKIVSENILRFLSANRADSAASSTMLHPAAQTHGATL